MNVISIFAIENFSCYACKDDSSNKFYKILDHEYCIDKETVYFECSSCGTISQHPMPTEKQLSDFYPDSYHSFSGNGLLTKIRLWMRYSRIGKYLKENDNFLDYGCGNGDFLYYVSKKHPQCKFFGYEISEKSEIIKSENVLIIKGSINLLLEKLPICKIITMNHTIEHIPQPDLIIKKLFEKLDNLGFIDGQTPSTQSVEKFLFKNYWSGFHAPRHTVIFSIKGITQIFLNVGFKEIVIKSAFNPASYAVSIGSVIKKNKNLLKREGLRWFALICIGSFLSFIDILFKKPNIINFKAVKYNNDKDGRF